MFTKMCILLHHFKTRRLEIKTQTLFKKKFGAQFLWGSHRSAGAKKILLSWTMDDFAMRAAKSLSHALLFKTLWVVVSQAPLSMGFSRQEHWSGFPCPPPRDLPNPGIGPTSLMSPALEGGFFTTRTPGKSPPFLVQFFIISGWSL